jgi:hypothetical protein
MLTRFVTIPTAALVLTALAIPVQGQEVSNAVEDGGVFVDGWMGKIDTNEMEAGQTLESARLAMDDGAMHVATGPAVVYWNPANTASGNYTVSATFSEPEYMNRNNHPHPYGIVVGGNGLDGDAPHYLYCAAYGNGNFIVRGFGPQAFQMNGRGESNEAVHRADGPGEPVTQEIAVSVSDDAVQCSINGTVVASYPVSEVVTEGRLTSTDGIYGIRFGHNTEALVSDLTLTTP